MKLLDPMLRRSPFTSLFHPQSNQETHCMIFSSHRGHDKHVALNCIENFTALNIKQIVKLLRRNFVPALNRARETRYAINLDRANNGGISYTEVSGGSNQSGETGKLLESLARKLFGAHNHEIRNCSLI